MTIYVCTKCRDPKDFWKSPPFDVVEPTELSYDTASQGANFCPYCGADATYLKQFHLRLQYEKWIRETEDD